MKFGRKSFLFIGLFMSILCMNNAKAQDDLKPCPAGCFCLNDGKYISRQLGLESKYCGQSATSFRKGWGQNEFCNRSVVVVADDVVNLSSYGSSAKIYHVGDFSEYWLSHYEEPNSTIVFGGYGFINGEFVYFFNNCTDDNILQCPETYPNSNEGAKALTDCFKYDKDGQKIYYGDTEPRIKLKVVDYNGWVPLVICQSGYYMPANTNECKRCTGDNACPGGIFYTDKIYTADRGIIACENGADSNHKACKADNISTKNANKNATGSTMNTQSSTSNTNSTSTITTTQTTETTSDSGAKKVTISSGKKDLSSVFNDLVSGKSATVPVARSVVGAVQNRESSESARTINHRAARGAVESPDKTVRGVGDVRRSAIRNDAGVSRSMR